MNSSINLGNGVVLTPEQLTQIIQANPQAFNRYYNELIAEQKAQTEQTAGNVADQYERDKDELVQGYTEDYRDLADSEGRKGTWGSSARAERENSLANKYNRRLSQAYGTASNNLANTYRNSEYNIGNVFNKRNISGYGVQPNQTTSTGSYNYNPFNFVGRVNADRNYSKDTMGLGSVASNFYNIYKGRQ